MALQCFIFFMLNDFKFKLKGKKFRPNGFFFVTVQDYSWNEILFLNGELFI